MTNVCIGLAVFGGLCQLPKIIYDTPNSMFACFVLGAAVTAVIFMAFERQMGYTNG